MQILKDQIFTKNNIIQQLLDDINLLQKNNQIIMGFENSGVSCYLNSVLQLILADNYLVSEKNKLSFTYDAAKNIVINELKIITSNIKMFVPHILYIACIIAFNTPNTTIQTNMINEFRTCIRNNNRQEFNAQKFIECNKKSGIQYIQEDAGELLGNILSLVDNKIINLRVQDTKDTISIQEIITDNKEIINNNNNNNLFLLVNRLSNNYLKNNYILTIENSLNITINNNTYILIAFIVHLGDNMNCGHYITYSTINNEYFHLNDSLVNKITKDQFVKEFNHAYILHLKLTN